MGMIKDINGKDLTKAEKSKKRWQEYTEELKKSQSIMNHAITHIKNQYNIVKFKN